MSAAKAQPDKKRIIIDYKNVTAEILSLLTDRYPYGYDESDMISYKNAQGQTVQALPVETKDTKYLIKIGTAMEKRIEAFIEFEEEEGGELEDFDKELETFDDEKED